MTVNIKKERTLSHDSLFSFVKGLSQDSFDVDSLMLQFTMLPTQTGFYQRFQDRDYS